MVARFVLVLVVCVPAVFAQMRIISHVTRAGGDFQTALILENLGNANLTVRLNGYSDAGSKLGVRSQSLSDGQVLVLDLPVSGLDHTDLAHISFDQPENLRITTVYNPLVEGGSPAHLSITDTSKAWRLFASNWQTVFDAIAIVNAGDSATDVSVSHYDSTGNLLSQVSAATGLSPLAKTTFVFGSPAGSVFQSSQGSFVVQADQELSVVALRGSTGGDSRFLYSGIALPITISDDSGGGPGVTPLVVTTVPDSHHEGFRNHFNQYVDVMGVHIYASRSVAKSKVLHAASVLAQYIDNDEDGVADEPSVLNAMTARNAFLFMFQDDNEMEDSPFMEYDELLDGGSSQSLFGEETNPNGEFDASLEECLHLVTHVGYHDAFPQDFGETQGSTIANAMDLARGGYFQNVPNSYPSNAWYTYDDETCDYACQIAEYFYWSLTSLLGGQSDRGDEISHEWRLYTAALFENGDPDMYELLTNPEYQLPTVLPDGSYGP